MERKAKPPPDISEVELHPDAWERFESAVRKAGKAAPMHRQVKKPPEPPKPKKRASR